MGRLFAMRWAIAVAVVAVALTGCRVPFVSSGASTTGSDSVPASVSTCTIYAQQHDTEVIVTPGRASECDALITSLTGGGLVWSATPNGASINSLTQQCDLMSSGGGYEAVVMDESAATVGQSTCSGFETAGWTASTQPGPLARYVSAHQQALQQQQVTASASVGQAQQATSAQAGLALDVSALQRASSALTGATTLTGGVNQMKRDYTQEQADYQLEQHDSCPVAAGDAQTVSQDYGTVTGDLNTLTGDIENLQVGDIQNVQSAVSSVNSDLAALQGLGVTPAVNSGPAVAAGNQALANAWNAIAAAQGLGKTINAEAEALAATAQGWATRHGC